MFFRHFLTFADMAENGKTVVVGVPSPMHPEGRNKLVKKKSALKLSSEAVEVYCRYEALDFSEDPRELWKDFYPDFQYEYPRYECGIFAIPSQDPDLPERLLIVYKFMERCASRIWKWASYGFFCSYLAVSVASPRPKMLTWIRRRQMLKLGVNINAVAIMVGGR